MLTQTVATVVLEVQGDKMYLNREELYNKIHDEKLGMTYDDIYMTPLYSEVLSRHNVSTYVEKGDLGFKLPIIASPMDTVCEDNMAIKMAEHGGLGFIHRYNSIPQQVELIKKCKGYNVGAAIGATKDFLERAEELYSAGCNMFCIDVAHGNHIYVKNAIEALRKKFGDNIRIMAGNVAEGGATLNLISWGADMIRIGVGGGSCCTTRVRTGHGVPNVTSVLDSAKAAEHKKDVFFVADGGIRSSGDIVKALALGADMVMLGSLLAGTEEAPGQTIIGEDGKQYKAFKGMASKEAQDSWRGKVSVAEGVSSRVPCKGPVENILNDLKKGVQSGLSYSGVSNIKEFRKKVNFGIQSSASIREGLPHIKLME